MKEFLIVKEEVPVLLFVKFCHILKSSRSEAQNISDFVSWLFFTIKVSTFLILYMTMNWSKQVFQETL